MAMYITEAGLSIWECRRRRGTGVQEQLFGNLDQLHQTTMYITEAGLSIWQCRRRRGTEVQEQLFGNLEQLTRWQCTLLRQDCPSKNAEEEEEPKSRSNCLATWSGSTRWQCILLRQDCPWGGSLAKRKRSPGATIWQPGAVPPYYNVHYGGKTDHLITQKKKSWNRAFGNLPVLAMG
jgi:hypothetical protein